MADIPLQVQICNPTFAVFEEVRQTLWNPNFPSDYPHLILTHANTDPQLIAVWVQGRPPCSGKCRTRLRAGALTRLAVPTTKGYPTTGASLRGPGFIHLQEPTQGLLAIKPFDRRRRLIFRPHIDKGKPF